MKEEWRDIEDYEGLYQVSNLGRVKNYKNRLLKPVTNYSTGYNQVWLSKRGTVKAKSIHRLVAFAFPEICGQYFEGAVVNHINEDKTDNRAENLEWVTPKVNTNFGNGINKRRISTKKPILQYSLDNNFIKEWKSGKDIKNNLGFDNSFITKCCKGKVKSCYGFRWVYK